MVVIARSVGMSDYVVAFCYEHKKHHVHGRVHIETEYKGMNEWWLCNACAERER